MRSGPAPPKYGSGTVLPAASPKNTPTGVSAKVCPTPIWSATVRIATSDGGDRRVLGDAEHPARQVVRRRELGPPVGDVAPLRVVVEGLVRAVERVGVDQRAAADAGPGEDRDVGQPVDALDAEAAQPRRPQEAPQVPRGARELVVGEPSAGLEHQHPVALLGQPQRA